MDRPGITSSCAGLSAGGRGYPATRISAWLWRLTLARSCSWLVSFGSLKTGRIGLRAKGSRLMIDGFDGVWTHLSAPVSREVSRYLPCETVFSCTPSHSSNSVTHFVASPKKRAAPVGSALAESGYAAPVSAQTPLSEGQRVTFGSRDGQRHGSTTRAAHSGGGHDLGLVVKCAGHQVILLRLTNRWSTVADLPR